MTKKYYRAKISTTAEITGWTHSFEFDITEDIDIKEHAKLVHQKIALAGINENEIDTVKSITLFTLHDIEEIGPVASEGEGKEGS